MFANDSCCYQDADALIKRIKVHIGCLFEYLFFASIMKLANAALVVSWSDFLRTVLELDFQTFLHRRPNGLERSRTLLILFTAQK